MAERHVLVLEAVLRLQLLEEDGDLSPVRRAGGVELQRLARWGRGG